jgi:hypothetical protein
MNHRVIMAACALALATVAHAETAAVEMDQPAQIETLIVSQAEGQNRYSHMNHMIWDAIPGVYPREIPANYPFRQFRKDIGGLHCTKTDNVRVAGANYSCFVNERQPGDQAIYYALSVSAHQISPATTRKSIGGLVCDRTFVRGHRHPGGYWVDAHHRYNCRIQRGAPPQPRY